MKQTIDAILRDTFAPTHLEVRDDSRHHAGHAEAIASGGGHFAVFIVSPQFHGLSPVARHRQIYAALASQLKTGIHALAITALTPDEQAGGQVRNL